VLAGSNNTALTMADHSVGTPAYMSPEQAFGEQTIDGRADLYSLACTLYEMVEGRTPFSGATMMAILVEKTTDLVRPLAAARSRVPSHVDGVLQRALAREPAARFASVGEFVKALSSTDATMAPVKRHAHSSIAVLPFANLGSDREDDFLSDGISEDLTHALAQLGGLRVAGRTSAFTFKGRAVDAREAGTALGVEAVLDGSLRRRGDRLRIVVHLSDVESGFELWSARFDRQFTDMFDVQDEITRSIVSTLRVKLAGGVERFVSTPTANMDAYEAYLRGRAAWNERTVDSLQRARQFLENAVELDPTFALAHAGLADCFVTLALYGVMTPTAAMSAAERAIGNAVTVERDMPEALTARASVNALYHWNWNAAESEFIGAIHRGASQSTAYQWYAMHLLAPRGRFDEALTCLEQARQLDPLSLVLEASLGMVYFYARRFDDAMVVLDALCVAHPEFALGTFFRGQVLTAVGRHAEAVHELEQLVSRTQQQAEVLAALAVAFAGKRDIARASRIRDELETVSRERYVSRVLFAQIDAALGDIEGAIDNLNAAFENRAADLTMLPLKPVFDPLRVTDGYRDLMQRLGLP
jgi:serine/threonine-protein kinase